MKQFFRSLDLLSSASSGRGSVAEVRFPVGWHQSAIWPREGLRTWGTGLPAQIPSFPQGKVPFFPRDKVFITGVHGDPRLDLPAKTPPVRIAGFFSQGTSDELAKVLQFCLFNKTRSVWRSAPPSCGGRGITRLLVTIISSHWTCEKLH